jgi:hypothetical protein
MQVLPLAHPRQIARLGSSSVVWYKLHQAWVLAAHKFDNRKDMQWKK